MQKLFYRCEVCGNMVGLIETGKGVMTCCEQPMTKLIPGSVDAAQEKHVPSVTLGGNTACVQVGSTLHPTTQEHYIQWIAITQGSKTQRIHLEPGDEPRVTFQIDSEDEPVTVYAYCNLHGLWKKECDYR